MTLGRFTTAGIPNPVLVADYRCAQCYGVLVELWKAEAGAPATDPQTGRPLAPAGAYVVSCPKGCQPGGFVTASYIDQARAADLAAADEVRAAYPFLADNQPKPTRDQAARARTALYGDPDDAH